MMSFRQNMAYIWSEKLRLQLLSFPLLFVVYTFVIRNVRELFLRFFQLFKPIVKILQLPVIAFWWFRNLRLVKSPHLLFLVLINVKERCMYIIAFVNLVNFSLETAEKESFWMFYNGTEKLLSWIATWIFTIRFFSKLDKSVLFYRLCPSEFLLKKKIRDRYVETSNWGNYRF